MPMESGLRGARVLVTASTQGIGLGTARAFLGEGARVIVNSSNPQHVEDAVGELSRLGEVHGVVADLRERPELDRLVEETVAQLGGIDTLVYVTGSPRPGIFLEQEYDDWSRAAELLVVSPAYLARRVADRMVAARRGGRMVFFTSTAIREPIPNIATSSVCRIAVAGLVRTLARELGPQQIRVNGILPGSTLTPRIEEVAADAARRTGTPVEVVRQRMVDEIPLRRMATTEELGRAAVFLGSDLSSYITGAMLPVDGGALHSVG